VHYATLNDYRFAVDEDDIRGAKLYGEGSQELGHIRDVVFEHRTGDIRYLVVDNGHHRRVLIPVDRVFRTAADEDSFSSEFTSDDLDHLPAFDEKILHNDRQWKDYEKLHESTMKDRNEVEQRYERQWTEDPVQHREGAPAHDITPVPQRTENGNVTSIDSGRRSHYVPDLTPQRIARVFTGTANDSSKINMVPQADESRMPAADYMAAGLGAKWNGFTERVKRDLHHIRGKCDRCDEKDTRAA
jgi:hypothetical protein